MATSRAEPKLAIPVLEAEPRNFLFDEDAFEKVLVLERKRSERSGDPFVLVCIDVRKLRDSSGRLDPVLRDLLFSVLGCTFRETDVIGWRIEEEVVGIILTELGRGATPAVTAKIRDKVQRCLECKLPERVTADMDVSVYFFPLDILEELPRQVRETLYPDLEPRRLSRRSTQILKRVTDVVGSLTLLLLLSPVMLLIAFLVKVTSRGPILYRQTRLGQYGKPFPFLKFRSMYTNADPTLHEQYIEAYIRQGKNADVGPDGKPIFKLVRDPRVTPVGRVLRKLSLDELPQLINVLKGDMSLVGPRPPIPYEIKRYSVWHRRRILEVKPGITGLWQVYGRSRTTFDDMVRLDLQYARSWSLWLDLKLLLLTPFAVLRGDGAC